MVNVCANYMGTTILIESFETKSQAEDFMKHDYIMHYADEFEDGTEDDIIYADEMFIEDEVPFYEPIDFTELNLDELPF